MSENKKEPLAKRLWEKAKYAGRKTVLFFAATVGLGQHTGEAMVTHEIKDKNLQETTTGFSAYNTMEKTSSADLNYADFADLEEMPKVYKPETLEKIINDKYNNMLVQNMLEKDENILSNFNLANYQWSREDLQMIGSSSQNDAILKTASKNVKKGRPQPGEQTYCLGAVKSYLAANGITLDASRFAYNAIEAMQKNDHFIELKGLSYKDFTALPDGAVVVLDKGKERPYGHIFIKQSQTWKGNTVHYDVSDYRYYLSDAPRPGYGDMHVFVLKDMTLSKELAMKMAKENIISNKYKAAFEINNAKQNYLASSVAAQRMMPTFDYDKPARGSQKGFGKTAANPKANTDLAMGLIRKTRNNDRI